MLSCFHARLWSGGHGAPTLVVVIKESEDSIDVDSMVRKYANYFELEVSVEVFDLRSLMSELDR